jgi:hypothetical protein
MSDIVIYQDEEGVSTLEVTLQDETLWLSQKQLAELFGVTIATINEHIKNIYKEHELEEYSTIRKFLIVQQEGNRKVKREIEHYNLDMIISVGYRVKSKIATRFRQWVTQQPKHDLKKYNTQHKPIELKPFRESHDRFMIIDESEVYHFGVSLKDLGKKWFAFSKFDVGAVEMLGRLS